MKWRDLAFRGDLLASASYRTFCRSNSTSMKDPQKLKFVITKGEIEAKAEEFGIHVSNVERDYVFGYQSVSWRSLWGSPPSLSSVSRRGESDARQNEPKTRNFSMSEWGYYDSLY